MEVHIGSLIKARAKTLRIGPTELGTKIDSSKQNVYGIFKRDSIDSNLLHRICIALDYDFFRHMSDLVHKQMGHPVAGDGAPKEDGLPQRVEDLVRECMYLRRLNGLLEEKLSRCESGAKNP